MRKLITVSRVDFNQGAIEAASLEGNLESPGRQLLATFRRKDRARWFILWQRNDLGFGASHQDHFAILVLARSPAGALAQAWACARSKEPHVPPRNEEHVDYEVPRLCIKL